ncbi:hypothetical protein GCM10009558_110440 [Virgisporangium aurantiacum]
MAAGGYDGAPVTFRPDRSFATALGGRPADGEWLVVVECFSPDAGRITERFVTPVTVTGTAWRLGSPPAGASGSAPGRPGDGAAPTTSTAASTATSTGAPGPGSGPDGERTRTAAERRAGPGGVPIEFLAGGLVLLIALATGGVMARRRRAGSAGGRS